MKRPMTDEESKRLLRYAGEVDKVMVDSHTRVSSIAQIRLILLLEQAYQEGYAAAAPSSPPGGE
jgi:hypothetical protein